MSYKVLDNKGSEIKFEIEVEKDKLDKITQIVLEDLSSSVKVSGFRPGKAPLHIVEKEVGKDKFWAEVVDKAIPESYFEALVNEKISPIGNPQIKVTQFIPGEKIVFEASVAVLSEIKDFKYQDLKIKPRNEKISEKDKNDALDGLLKKQNEEISVKRAAKLNDKVEIDFEGTMTGLPFDGGTSKNHPVILGSNMLIPGFEEKIVGHKAGDEFDIDITFPTDYHAKNLSGQKTNFKVKLNNVYEIVTPKADDDFAKKVGFETLEKLKEELSKELEFQKGLEQKRLTEEDILKKIIEKNKIEAPNMLIEEETHRMIHEAEHNLSGSGLTMEQFLEMSKKTLSDLENEMKPEAEKRVKIGIVLGEVAKQENINVEEKEIDAEIDRIVSITSKGTSADDVKAAYETPDKRREIGNTLVIHKTMQKLWDKNILK